MRVSQLTVVKKRDKKIYLLASNGHLFVFCLGYKVLQLMDSKEYFLFFSPFIGNSYGWVCLFSIKANILPSSALEPMCLSQIYCAPGAPEGLKTWWDNSLKITKFRELG